MSGPKLSLRQLHIFLAVAEHGSTAAAADAIALSQSATSAALNELESVLGLELFDRVGKRLHLNSNGRSLLPRARAVIDSVRGIETWASDADTQLGALRIGASTTIGNYLLPALLARFIENAPAAARAEWQASVSIENTRAICELVASFQIDVGLIEGPSHDPSLSVTPWIEDELLVVCGPDDPIRPSGGDGRVGLDALREAVWLLRESGSGTREVVSQALVRHLHHLRTGIEFGNAEAIKRATAQGLGIACLSRYVVADMVAAGELVILPTELPRLSRRFYIVTHRQKVPTRGLERFLEHLAREDEAARPPRQ
jgi:DNA-binding transcriptional LysR family regulator